MRTCVCFLILLFYSHLFHPLKGQTKYTISGYISEKGSKELLVGAIVYVPLLQSGSTSNNYGFYSLTLPAADSLEIRYSYVGYQTITRVIRLDKNLALDIEITPENMLLKEIVVQGERGEKVSDSERMSVIEIPVQQIKEIPTFLGEKDVFRILQLLPGVQSGNEGNNGLYVRGGSPDQNLIILDDAPVYNASHLFGFFSIFNGNALKSIELTKGGFPARYGGRLSSVLDIQMKDGNKERWAGEGAIGLIASHLTLEAPLKKNVSSFLISGRRTYLDALLYPFLPTDEKVGYYFYDLNAKINYDFGRKDKLYLSGYFGEDRFYINQQLLDFQSKGRIFWGNATATLRWNHLFNEKLFSNLSLIYSTYKFQVEINEKKIVNGNTSSFNLRYKSGIRDFALKYDLDFIPSPNHYLKFGLLSTLHRFTPSAVVLKDTGFNEFREDVDAIDVLESGIYVEDTYRPNPKWSIKAGVRFSHFLSDRDRQYARLEPRLTLAYRVKEGLSIKGAYSLMNQYVHLLSNTSVGLPTDLWVPTTRLIPPQMSQQFAMGIAKDFNAQNLALTIEGYYKKSDNIIGYKEGASFLLIDDVFTSNQQIPWENNVTSGTGWSYGLEFFLQKKTGKFSGWAGYTLSWTQLQFDSLNFGKKFFARHDRRHDIKLVGIFKVSPRITLSAVWVYGTGNAITLPKAEYSARAHLPLQSFGFLPELEDLGSKNDFRMRPYHRLDFGVQFHKKKQKHERTWEISIYNIYSRQNQFYYFIQRNSNTMQNELKQVALFLIIPSFSYRFKF